MYFIYEATMTDQSIPPGVQQYFRNRVEGEIDLVQSVRQALINAGIGGEIQVFDTDANICVARNMNSSVQLYKLNTFLDTQYMSLKRDVSSERSMLLSDATPENWLQIFIDYHIPFMKAMGLPKAYPL